jgi:ornithine cyclodeaminase/alanine dehydrogenase-like protein (mu-crystallin family)
MTQRLELPVEAVGSVEDALRGADVVDLCAPGHHDVREPLFEGPWVAPGALVVSMAQKQYSDEFRRQARLVASYSFAGDDAAQLATVIVDGANPRQTASDRVNYQLEGGTVQDLFVATWGYEWAKARGLGTPFDLSA